MKPKYRRSQVEALAELLDRGGVVMSSEWVTGRGRFVSLRQVPPFARRIRIGELWMIRGEVRTMADRLVRSNPRITKLVVVTDLRSARRLIREHNEKGIQS